MKFSFHDGRLRALAYQAAALGTTLALAWFLVGNTLENLAERNIASGFAFLGREAGFAIGETTFLSYSAADTYLRALAVGLANTARVAVIGILAATALGTLIGLARLSRNWLVARVAAGYVEFVRNVPLLVQLFFLYAVMTEYLPAPRAAFQPLPGLYLSNRGIFLPVPEAHPVYGWMLIACLAGLIAALLLRRWAATHRVPGRRLPLLEIGLSLALVPPALAYLLAGAPTALDVPKLAGFNFTGGMTISPEFATLAGGLILYTAAFIAEIVRAGVQSVPSGQSEAAYALGLSSSRTLRHVVLPQALQAIVPPLTNQYLNLTKNSSLAVAIGYPDLVSIANTTINQTGQAIEGIAIIMIVYLTISLSISALMNWYNARVALRGRG
ncbi:MAG TPA: ABC transporter permease subunit [Burkholderiales bacterium]|nr:ABC transporter permease subunit [Burkholderiales bacterium]